MIMTRIPGFTRYTISESGVVYSTIKERVLLGNINEDGYRQVHLVDDNGVSLIRRVHRLVALTFIPNPDNLPVINHKDGNKLNNDSSNLEWCTSEYNSTHAASIGLYNIRWGARNHTSRRVLNTKTGVHYETIKEAAKSISKNRHDLARALRGVTKNNTNFIYA
jgi:hypothetical protein